MCVCVCERERERERDYQNIFTLLFSRKTCLQNALQTKKLH